MEIERKYTRKVYNNVRGVVRLGCILSPPTYKQTHYRPEGCERYSCTNPSVDPGNRRSVFTYNIHGLVPERLNGTDCKPVDS